MAWWSRVVGGGRRRSSSSSSASAAAPVPGSSSTHLREFARTRVGVEAYLEPATNDTGLTLLLIATDGEWTRRRVPDARTAEQFARDLAMPLYDVNFTGYPQRMRDWNARQRRGR